MNNWTISSNFIYNLVIQVDGDRWKSTKDDLSRFKSQNFSYGYFEYVYPNSLYNLIGDCNLDKDMDIWQLRGLHVYDLWRGLYKLKQIRSEDIYEVSVK